MEVGDDRSSFLRGWQSSQARIAQSHVASRASLSISAGLLRFNRVVYRVLGAFSHAVRILLHAASYDDDDGSHNINDLLARRCLDKTQLSSIFVKNKPIFLTICCGTHTGGALHRTGNPPCGRNVRTDGNGS